MTVLLDQVYRLRLSDITRLNVFLWLDRLSIKRVHSNGSAQNPSWYVEAHDGDDYERPGEHKDSQRPSQSYLDGQCRSKNGGDGTTKRTDVIRHAQSHTSHIGCKMLGHILGMHTCQALAPEEEYEHQATKEQDTGLANCKDRHNQEQ